MTRGRYTSNDVIELTGLSYRQLDRYASVGCFGDRNAGIGGGRRRAYLDIHLVVAGALAELLPLGGVIAGQGQRRQDGVRTGIALDLAVKVAEAIRSAPDAVRLLITADQVIADDGSTEVPVAALRVDLGRVRCRLHQRMAEVA